MVLFRQDLPVGSVQLDGNVRVPGVRSLTAAPDVRTLVGSYDTFLDDPYLLFGAIQTTDPRTRAHRLVPINLEAIMNGRTNVSLKDGDVVIVLSVGDINYLASADVQAVLEGKRPPLLVERIVTQNPRSSVGQRPAASVEAEVRPFGAETSPTVTQRAQNPQTATATGNAPEGTANYAASNMLTAPVPLAPNQAPGAAPGSTVVLIPGSNGVLPNYSGSSNAPPPPPFDKAQFAQQSLQICRGLQQLVAIATTGRPGLFANAIYSVASGNSVPSSAEDTKIDNIFPCPSIFDKYPELLPLIVENATNALEGEVRIPGPYPIVAGTSLSSVVDEAGGLAREVDLKRVEVTHFSVNNLEGNSRTDRQLVQLNATDLERVALSPGDIVRFNPVVTDRDNGLVSLTGEFRRPGFFDIVRGERLSQLIARAGGFTEEAYPYGAVFTRAAFAPKSPRQVRQIGRPASIRAAHGTGAYSRETINRRR